MTFKQWKPYLAIVSARFRMLLQYRAAAAAGLGTQLFWGLIRVMIFEAFYRSSTTRQPLSYQEVVTYTWLGQATIALLLTGVDTEVREMIRTGSVAYELVRPVDLYTLWFSRAVASRAAPTLLRCVPLMTLAGLFFGLGVPHSWASGCAWAVTTVGALVLASALWTLTTITLLWTISGEGISRLIPTLSYLFSGMLIPIPLCPAWSQPILNFLPFRGLMDTPFRLYLGSAPPEQVFPLLLHQASWTLALILYGRWLLDRSIRRMVVQGG